MKRWSVFLRQVSTENLVHLSSHLTFKGATKQLTNLQNQLSQITDIEYYIYKSNSRMRIRIEKL